MSAGQAARLAFSFMSDDEIDRFATFAQRSARAWANLHGDALRAKAAAEAAAEVAGGAVGGAGVHLVRWEDLLEDESAAAAIDGVAKFLGVGDTPGSQRAHCARILATRAVGARELTTVQQATSMDQLYEGKLVCKMWAVLHAEAAALGYSEPFNRMPCHHAVDAAVDARGAEVAPCGWLHRWPKAWGAVGMHKFVSSCAGRKG